MKRAFVLAVGALLGLAEAGIHKMKLQKVPLSEQLVRRLSSASYSQSAFTDGINLPGTL